MLDGVFKKHGTALEDLYETDWDLNVKKYYSRLWSFICDKKTIMLQPIQLNIPEKQQFYSKSDKKHLFLGPTWQMYLISEKKDENGCVMVYSPYTFAQGQVFLVPKHLIIRLGYN
ncbi:hypothetical protein N8467_00610 [bacterium]|jgi:hypothetical protein|nr:hypothetical protein [bacterium]